MTHQEALAKAVKLLRLSQSNHPAEAASAAAKAQEIIDRFKLGAISMDYTPNTEPDEEIKDFGNGPLENGGKLATWKGWLATSVCKLNQCKAYKSSGRLCVVGRPSDVSTVRYIYSWICREVDQLTVRNCKGNGATYCNNYRIGVVETVCKRLEQRAKETVVEVKQEAIGNESALVRINQSVAKMEATVAAVNDYCEKKLRLRSGGKSSFRSDNSARTQGRLDGYSVRISPSAGAVGRGSAGYIS